MTFHHRQSLLSSATSLTTTNNNYDIIDKETIECLCNRLQSATHFEDRRNAVLGIKSFSKKCKSEVGRKSIKILANILHDTTDVNLIQVTLETLINLVTLDVDTDKEKLDVLQNIVVELTEKFIETEENVYAVLECITKNDFHVRREAIRFLTSLLENCTEQIQNIILKKRREGFLKLMNLLDDKREDILSDALLLFQNLIRSHSNIQLLFVLENGFQRLSEIFVDKYGTDGGVIVEDYLSFLLSLFEYNQIAQSCFLKLSQIPDLFGFFQSGLTGEKCWSTQKVKNVLLLLQIIRTLASPTNSMENIVACQCIMKKWGILYCLYGVLTLTTVPTDVLAETINTIGDIVRGNAENQCVLGPIKKTFVGIPKPTLFHRLYRMVADKKTSFQLQISILYCLQCYLYKNDFGKLMIIQTLLPQTENAANETTLGHLLINGYLSNDNVASWCSGIALVHLIHDNLEYKHELLKVVIALDQSQTNIKTLMEISIDLLQNPLSSFHKRIAALIFLCTWLSNCSLAVQALISIENSISYLISQICIDSIADERELLIQSLCSFALGLCLFPSNNNQIQSYSTESFKELINKRIGVNLFQEKLRIISKSEFYIKALEKPQLKFLVSNEMIFDYEFAHLYETLQSSISNILTKQETTNNLFIVPTSISSDDHELSIMMTHENDLVQRQNVQINI